MPDGTVQGYYDGVKVRVTPLPLRFVGQPNEQPQHQSIVVQNSAPPNPPNSPILTHLLHRKSPAPDQTNPQVNKSARSKNHKDSNY
jgi:hypothetical protein